MLSSRSIFVKWNQFVKLNFKPRLSSHLSSSTSYSWTVWDHTNHVRCIYVRRSSIHWIWVPPDEMENRTRFKQHDTPVTPPVFLTVIAFHTTKHPCIDTLNHPIQIQVILCSKCIGQIGCWDKTPNWPFTSGEDIVLGESISV